MLAIDIPAPIKMHHAEDVVGGHNSHDPKHMKGTVSDDVVNKILKFMYYDQDFEAIRYEITADNVSGIYSQAYVLNCKTLLKYLEEMIVNEHLNPDNASRFYHDAIMVSPMN